LGGILTHEPFLDTLGHPENDAWTIPMISSAYTLAALVTSGFLMFFTRNLGRKGTVLLGCLGCIIGTVIQTSTFSVAQLIVGRVITGFGQVLMERRPFQMLTISGRIGCISTSVPTYLAETGAENGDRGPANAINGVRALLA
jgi:MFS family permease